MKRILTTVKVSSPTATAAITNKFATYSKGVLSFQYPMELKVMNNREFAKLARWETVNKNNEREPAILDLGVAYLVTPDAVPAEGEGMGPTLKTGYAVEVRMLHDRDNGNFDADIKLREKVIAELNAYGNAFHLETVALAGGGTALISDEAWEVPTAHAGIYDTEGNAVGYLSIVSSEALSIEKGFEILKSVVSTVKIN